MSPITPVTPDRHNYVLNHGDISDLNQFVSGFTRLSPDNNRENKHKFTIQDTPETPEIFLLYFIGGHQEFHNRKLQKDGIVNDENHSYPSIHRHGTQTPLNVICVPKEGTYT